MKKFVVSVFLAAVFCGSAFCSGVDNFGDNPEEKEFLTSLESVVKEYYNRDKDDDCEDISDLLEYCVIFYKEKYSVDDKTNKFLYMLIGEVDEFCDHLGDLFIEGEDNAAMKILENWSIHQLLEEVKK